MKPVLLLIDLQEDFYRNFSLLKPRALFERNVATLASSFRERSLPVIHLLTRHRADRSTWTRHMKRDDFRICMEGTPGMTEIPAAARKAGETVFYKTRWSAFFKTGLEEELCNLGIDTVVLAGFMTHACIRVTAVDAYQRDYGIVIARECVDSYDAVHEKITLEYLGRYAAKIMDNREIAALLDSR